MIAFSSFAKLRRGRRNQMMLIGMAMVSIAQAVSNTTKYNISESQDWRRRQSDDSDAGDIWLILGLMLAFIVVFCMCGWCCNRYLYIRDQWLHDIVSAKKDWNQRRETAAKNKKKRDDFDNPM